MEGLRGNPRQFESNLICVSKNTANVVKRFYDEDIPNTLPRHYPQLNSIIARLCNTGASAHDILNFLVGKISLAKCDCKGVIVNIADLIGQDDSILVDKEDGGEYIRDELAECLNKVLGGGVTGFWRDTDDKEDKLELLYKLTLPQQSARDLEKIDFAGGRNNHKFPIEQNYSFDVEQQELQTCFAPNLVANCANRVQLAIAKSNRYDHMKFNQLLGTENQALSQLTQEKTTNYFSEFASCVGITVEQVPLYLETHPITILYDQELTNFASSKSFSEPYEAPQFAHITQLCAVKSFTQDKLLVKYGAVTSIPGAFAFGTVGCDHAYNKNNVHFGVNIHAIGLNKTKMPLKEVYDYYRRLYSLIIETALAQTKIDCLVLNGVGDGHFANNVAEKRVNAKARLDALIAYKDKITYGKGMRIILTDYAQNFNQLHQEDFEFRIDELAGMSYIILSGEEANLQGQKLAHEVRKSNYVGVVNASDPRQYGCYFLEMLGDHTVEELIWNQLFFGAHYDAVVAGYCSEGGEDKYIKLEHKRFEKVENHISEDKDIKRKTKRIEKGEESISLDGEIDKLDDLLSQSATKASSPSFESEI